MLRNQLQFQQQCPTNIDSIKPQKRTRQPHQYDSCINNPLTQQFSNIKLSSTLSAGRSVFQKQLEHMKQQYIIRTGYIRIADTEVMKNLFELNLENMKKKYSKYSNINQLNIPKQMLQIFHKFGYKEINTFMQMAIVHLLFEFKSLLQYQDKWEKDAVIALTSIAFIRPDCLYPQILIITPDDEGAISIRVMLDHLNINYNNVYQVSKRNSIVDDRKHLKEAQVVIGPPDRVYYVIKQKYLNPIFLESVVFQEFSQTTDFGHGKDIESILTILPKTTSRHFFFSQVFSEEEHNLLDI